MRPLLCLFAAMSLLVACQMQGADQTEASGDGVAPLGVEAIAVTTLDAPAALPAVAAQAAPISAAQPRTTVAVQVPGPATPRPEPRPGPQAEPAASATDTVAEPEAAAPAPPSSPEQAACRKAGGQWATTDSGTSNVCVKKTRDSGKTCQSKNDCQGECLARSGTCAPITPLMGCNDVLQFNGAEVTLCLQ